MVKAFSLIINSVAKGFLPIITGFIFWIIFILLKLPLSFFKIDYLQILILAAPLWIIPIALKRLHKVRINLVLTLISAALLSFSFLIVEGAVAASLTLPWLLTTLFLAVSAFTRFLVNKNQDLIEYLKLGAFLFLAIGAFWAFIHRLGMNFMGFDDTIILLTVAHFHYAGFILPTLAAQALKEYNSKFFNWAGWGVLIGIPLLALGITLTEFNFPIILESIFALVMAGSAFTIGLVHLLMSKKRKGVIRLFFFLCGLCLMSGMCLAFCYALRPFFTIPILSIPFMYAVHGTLNAIGFAIPGVMAWALD